MVEGDMEIEGYVGKGGEIVKDDDRVKNSFLKKGGKKLMVAEE
jgi:hypothetical protein